MKRLYNYQDFILETSKYKSINDVNFLKLFNRIVEFHGETNKTYIDDFKQKLYTFLSSDEHKMFKVDFFNKSRKSMRLLDVIHELDMYNAKILLKRGEKHTQQVSLDEMKPVWEDKEKGISVYRANNVFESIKLGRNTNFCISSSLDGNYNYFYDYMYEFNISSISHFQKSTIYFVISPNQKPEFRTLAIDFKHINSYKFLYTDVRNKDEIFETYKDMVDSNNTSPDLEHIPEEVFEFVEHIPTIEEIKYDIRLAICLGKEKMYKILNEYIFSENSYIRFIDYLCQNFIYSHPDIISSLLDIIFDKLVLSEDKFLEIFENIFNRLVFYRERIFEILFKRDDPSNKIYYSIISMFNGEKSLYDVKKKYIGLIIKKLYSIKEEKQRFFVDYINEYRVNVENTNYNERWGVFSTLKNEPWVVLGYGNCFTETFGVEPETTYEVMEENGWSSNFEYQFAVILMASLSDGLFDKYGSSKYLSKKLVRKEHLQQMKSVKDDFIKHGKYTYLLSRDIIKFEDLNNIKVREDVVKHNIMPYINKLYEI